jgi:hypothetical protein
MLRIHPADISCILPLALLSPSIVEQIFNGSQPGTLTPAYLRRGLDIPADWSDQRAAVFDRQAERRLEFRSVCQMSLHRFDCNTDAVVSAIQGTIAAINQAALQHRSSANVMHEHHLGKIVEQEIGAQRRKAKTCPDCADRSESLPREANQWHLSH